MSLQVTRSFDNLGEYKGDTALQTYGGANRDAVVQFNAFMRFQANRTFENPTFAIDTNFDIKNTEPVTFFVGGVAKTLADDTSWDTGTAAVIAANCWGIAILCHSGSATVLTWAADAMSYPTEAAAIAALGTLSTLAPAAANACLGYVTVKTGTDVTWTAGTDALEGGAGGTPSSDTNYYNDPSLNGWFSGQQIGNEYAQPIAQ